MRNIKNNQAPVIFLMGPTASGKTSIAIDLVKSLPADIISVDSAMVYRGLDIGTAKPSIDIQKIAPHRLIDICNPIDTYSAGKFVCDALIEIKAIQSNNRIPLLVGGTGMYFRALEQGFSELPSTDSATRTRLASQAREFGWEYMYSRLAEIDPDSAERIHKNDPQRIQRALEIYEITGKSATQLYSEGRVSSLNQPVIKIIVAPENRKNLHITIEKRFLQMIKDGLIEEVKALYEQEDINANLPSMRMVGYRQVWSYLDREISYNDMINKGIIATRQLAKRQLTWFRSEANALWIDSNKPELLDLLLNYIQFDTTTTSRI
ncbi:MAG: tRNA dimethylallyltransferase [Gammaproteobacteria bacterium]|jgi:tRNA dimethylallyltransferase